MGLNGDKMNMKELLAAAAGAVVTQLALNWVGFEITDWRWWVMVGVMLMWGVGMSIEADRS